MHSPLVFSLLKVVASSEGHEVGIVGWSWERHTSGAAHVRVTQLIRQTLEFVCREVIVVPQHVIVRWTASALGEREEKDMEEGGPSRCALKHM